VAFRDSKDVLNYIGGIFETAFKDEVIGPKLKETGLVVAFDFTDPEALVVVDMANQKVTDSADGLNISATMSMSAETGNAYWQGKVNLPMAMAKKKIRVEGNVASLLKLAPLGKSLYPRYIERLKQDGRDDLLV
jgi:putative sterol carrier protein